jgi:hypothetical protein
VKRVPDPDQHYDHRGKPAGGKVRYIWVNERKPLKVPPKPGKQLRLRENQHTSGWQEWEDRAVLLRTMPEDQLAETLGRTKQAVKTRRKRLRARQKATA